MILPLLRRWRAIEAARIRFSHAGVMSTALRGLEMVHITKTVSKHMDINVTPMLCPMLLPVTSKQREELDFRRSHRAYAAVFRVMRPGNSTEWRIRDDHWRTKRRRPPFAPQRRRPRASGNPQIGERPRKSRRCGRTS